MKWALLVLVVVLVAFAGCASEDLVKPSGRALSYQNYDASKQGKVLLLELGKRIIGLGVAIPDAINAGVATLDAMFTDIGNNSLQQLKNWGGLEKMPAESKAPYSPSESEKQRKKSEEEHAETWYYALGSAALALGLSMAKLYGRSLPFVGPVVGWALDLWGKGIGNGAATNEKVGDALQQVIDDVKGRLPSVLVDRLKEILPAILANKIPAAELATALDSILGDLGETVKAQVHERIRAILGDKDLLTANTKLYEGATLA